MRARTCSPWSGALRDGDRGSAVPRRKRGRGVGGNPESHAGGAGAADPDVPPKLEEIIGKAMEKDRKLRYQRAAEIRTDLQRLRRDSESVARSPRRRLESKRSLPQTQRWWMAACATILVPGVAVGGRLFSPTRPTR